MVKKYRPVTKSRRSMKTLDFAEITRSNPEKSLVSGNFTKSSGGRNNQGRITTRFRGGGAKRKYREIDFKRNKFDIIGKIGSIEYDPNRSANIALVSYIDGDKSYIIAPLDIKIGDKVISGSKAEIRIGNAKRLKDIPDGIDVHNIEMIPGSGAKIARSAGQFATIRAKELSNVLVRLSSGEIRKFNKNCIATIGQVGNIDKINVSLGKAGKKRYLGRRPHVRGVAMNPVDHPMGGGEGKTSGGGHPVSPWGKLSKGGKTRKRNKNSNKMIITKRKKK